ncbi:MAG: BMP family ABC transporter substrate-binding protein [Synechococcaceae cyanobacterium SM2_3_1]|nr:BMP family ABC transporter substrate-binding protein [Synechococcaceae cyanobacterium SM2_3_1]
MALVVVAPSQAQRPLRVGIAFDVGGKNDRSFNQAVATGATWAQEQLGIQIIEFEPTEAAAMETGVEDLAQAETDLVVGVGFGLEPAITEAAETYPDTRFAVIDAESPNGENVASLIFEEQEGAFLVGYIAGSLTQTGVVGFVGGMDIPLIHRFEVGYRAGVEYACTAASFDCEVLIDYVGTTPAAWNQPLQAQAIARNHLSQGADIIFAAAGGSGLGVIDQILDTHCLQPHALPANVNFIRDPFATLPKPEDYTQNCPEGARPVFFIGVDANQNYLGDSDQDPLTLNYGLTSMLKRVDVATLEIIEAVQANEFQGGIHRFSLANDGVGYALDEYNRSLLPPTLLTEVETLKQEIRTGTITVPSSR